MNWVKTINDAIEYMEGHLTDEITLADIAKHVTRTASSTFSSTATCSRRRSDSL